MSFNIHEYLKNKCEYRKRAAVNCTDNVYEQLRVRIVRVVREAGDISSAAKQLGVSDTTVRKYLRFVPFEHLMRDPALANRFDWRSMTGKKWVKLLRKHPQFMDRLPKKILYCSEEADILIAQPQLAPCFDLDRWNRYEMGNTWSRLLARRPDLADRCDFSTVTALAAKNLLAEQPQFFDRIPIETLLPYHWTELFRRQPQLEEKMRTMPRDQWPFNFWVHALQFHPELEAEFEGWEKIAEDDIPDFKQRQPEMYQRHWQKCGIC